MEGVGSFSVEGYSNQFHYGSALLSGGSSLTAEGHVENIGSAYLIGSGSLSCDGATEHYYFGSALLHGISSSLLDGHIEQPGSALLHGMSQFEATGQAVEPQYGTAHFFGEGSFSCIGLLGDEYVGNAVLISTAGLGCDGVWVTGVENSYCNPRATWIGIDADATFIDPDATASFISNEADATIC